MTTPLKRREKLTSRSVGLHLNYVNFPNQNMTDEEAQTEGSIALDNIEIGPIFNYLIFSDIALKKLEPALLYRMRKELVDPQITAGHRTESILDDIISEYFQ